MLAAFLEVAERLCLVVGGGPVGRRKARVLGDAGARVRLVCLEPRPAEGVPPAVTWLTEPYRPQHLDGVSLAFAAASPAINRRVIADAWERGVWVNAAEGEEAGDFHLPAVLRRGPFQVAVSTGGAAPALARAVRDRLEEQFDEAFGRWVELLAEWRPVILAQVGDAGRRRLLFEQLCDWGWLELIRAEQMEAVREALRLKIAQCLKEE
jgi:siroheme synthase-like protein